MALVEINPKRYIIIYRLENEQLMNKKKFFFTL